MACVIALDVGGSAIKSAVVPTHHRTDFSVTTTSLDSRGEKNDILNVLRGVIAQHFRIAEEQAWTCVGIGLGFPGPFDYERGVAQLKSVDKFDALYGLNLRVSLAQPEGGPSLPIRFGNDAVVAILAEARNGVGRKYKRVLGICLGTGMGSAFIINGVQAFGEPGIPASGFLFAEPFFNVRADDCFSTRGLEARLRPKHRGLTIEAAAIQAREGDSALRKIFREFGRDLGTFLSSYAASFGADVVVLLGGISLAADLFVDSLECEVSIPVEQGVLGQKAGVLGASLLFD